MRRKLVVAGGLVVITLIAIISINSYFKTHTPTRQVSQKFISYVLQGDASSSYGLFSADAQKAQRRNEWANTVKTFSLIFKDKSSKYDYSRMSKQNIIETYNITDVNGRNYTFVVNCVKDGGNWKVYSFISSFSSPPSNSNHQQASNSSGSGS